MPVRMKDIADELGLSVVTVSKVLRNHPDISKKTRERVLKRMDELKYQPNLAARSLSTGRTNTVGLIVPDLLHPFFAQIAATVSAEVRKLSYGLIIASSDEDPELEQQEIAQLLARRVDVILIASAQRAISGFDLLTEQDVPYVLLDRRFDGHEANFVGIDDHAAGLLATQHLIEQGCRHIAHIHGPSVSTAAGRYAGYQQALAAAGLPLNPGHVVSIGESGDHRGEAGGYRCAQMLLAATPRPDGLFCYNDPGALGAMQAILDASLRIPEDIAVIGCGNLPYSDFLRVPLSTIDQNTQLIGERAATLALSLAQEKVPAAVRTEFLPPHLIVRRSSLRHPSQTS